MDRLQKLMNPQFFYKHDRPHKVRLFWNREVLNDFEKRQKKAVFGRWSRQRIVVLNFSADCRKILKLI